MRKIERVPSISSDCHFPIADITDQKKLSRASAWIAYADTLRKDDFKHFMDIRYVPRNIDSAPSRSTYNAAVFFVENGMRVEATGDILCQPDLLSAEH